MSLQCKCTIPILLACWPGTGYDSRSSWSKSTVLSVHHGHAVNCNTTTQPWEYVCGYVLRPATAAVSVCGQAANWNKPGQMGLLRKLWSPDLSSPAPTPHTHLPTTTTASVGHRWPQNTGLHALSTHSPPRRSMRTRSTQPTCEHTGTACRLGGAVAKAVVSTGVTAGVPPASDTCAGTGSGGHARVVGATRCA